MSSSVITIALIVWVAWTLGTGFASRHRAVVLHQRIEQSVDELLGAIEHRHLLLTELCELLSQQEKASTLRADVVDQCRKGARKLSRCLASGRGQTELEALAAQEIELRASVEALWEDLGNRKEKGEKDVPLGAGVDPPLLEGLAEPARELADAHARFSFLAEAYNDAIATFRAHQQGWWASLWCPRSLTTRHFIDWEPEPSGARTTVF